MSFVMHRPLTVAEAVDDAHRLGVQARFIAGGTDLMIQMNRKRVTPEHVIDISRLPGLSGIEDRGDRFVIGALTTHKELERYAPFAPALAALSESAAKVGGHQVRNIATIGGNIANASPAADVVVALLALDAELTLAGPNKTLRNVMLADFLRGPGKTMRAVDELLVSVTVPKPKDRAASTFLKAGRRKAMEISVVCIAVRVSLNSDGKVSGAGISLGAVGPTALRARESEAVLMGKAPDAALFNEAGRLAAAACTPISDVRASADYRRHLVEALVPRGLSQCLERMSGAAR